MAINDISLTSGMRSNLTTLQSTAKLLDRTQYRLATGKKVNSAIDNPTSFFAAQSLNSRASIIDGLKDAMGQAIQTVTAADKGITAITSLIEQAKGVAQAAAAAPASSGVDTVAITLSGITAGDVVTVGTTAYTATGAGTPGSDEFYVNDNDTANLLNLADAINANTSTTGYRASVSNDVLTISKENTITHNPEAVTLADVSSDVTDYSEELVSGNTELDSLMTQYNIIRDQITTLAADSGYKGKNLLTDPVSGTGLLIVKFEGSHSLTVTGFSAAAADLGITQATWTTDPTSIGADLTKLDDALSKLRQNASSFSANLSIITTRQDFSTNMVSTLTDGADKLTLADTNEEGANMLMLQTRQSLGTTALSLSAQAAQSVLRLFG